ncbi:MAG: hydantoinase/oxoprolinase family protein [Deferrisomatales bacterium]
MGGRRQAGRGSPAGGERVVGIDTGGTYTDAALLDYSTRRVLATSKALTTPADLTQGISAALAGLALAEPARVQLVCLSSTLATNAVAEGRGARVGLALFGYDRELLERYELVDRLPAHAVGYFAGGHRADGSEQGPPDLVGFLRWARRWEPRVDAFAISAYFSPLDPSHEERAAAALRSRCALPVVLGHELSRRLDSVRRAVTASLNASLVPVMSRFLEAARTSVERFGIRAPLMIVRGDGSLVDRATAAARPVETILSGPAASAVGARFLSGRTDALVVDMGGTTTDLALLEQGRVALVEEGASVGPMTTAVRSARLRTACLGGDSRLRLRPGGAAAFGPQRVTPLCRLAARHPRVEEELRRRLETPPETWSAGDVEYVQRAGGAGDPSEPSGRVLAALEEGPLSVRRLLETLGLVHPLHLGLDELAQAGRVERATLTPTDLLHADGRLELWSADAARAALQLACGVYGLDPAAAASSLLERFHRAVAEEIVVYLARAERPDLPPELHGPWARWFAEKLLAPPGHPVEVRWVTSLPVVGIGAPADLLLGPAVRKLGMAFLEPARASAANAVGAAAASVIGRGEAVAYYRERGGSPGYLVFAPEGRRWFAGLEPALAYARASATDEAVRQARAMGAVAPRSETDLAPEGSGYRIVARAVGSPRLG